MKRGQRVWAILLATLREIFDESAYARFLARTSQSPGRASYEKFLQERQAVAANRIRCC